MTTQTPSGWYPDPYGSPQLRWWDGSQWTDATHSTDAPAGQSASQAPQTGPLPQPTGPHSSPAGPGEPLPGPGEPPGQQRDQQGMPAPEGARVDQPRWVEQPGGTTMQMPAASFGYPSGPPPRKKNPLPWILGGGGVVALIVVIAIAAMFLMNPDSEPTASDATQPPTTTQAPSSEPTPETTQLEPPAPEQPNNAPPLPQPQNGRIQDPATGLSYEFPGTPWQVPQSVNVDPLGLTWTSGAVAVSHADYDGQGSNWLGNVFAGELPAGVQYTGPGSMKAVAATLLQVAEPLYYSPEHLRKIVKDEAIKVSGKDAWVLMFDLDFSKESAANGWKWKKERGAFVIVDRGAAGPPALVYVSVPDNLDMSVADRVVKSLKLS
jgi:hypothetical protein